MSIEQIVGWDNFVVVFGTIGLSGGWWLFIAWYMNMIRGEGYNKDDKPQHSSKGYSAHKICDNDARSDGESRKPRQDSTALRPFAMPRIGGVGGGQSKVMDYTANQLQESQAKLDEKTDRLKALQQEFDDLKSQS